VDTSVWVSRSIAKDEYFRLPRAQLSGLILVTEETRQAEMLESDATLLFVHNLPVRIGVRKTEIRMVLSSVMSEDVVGLQPV
jgi:hypothetical protein